MIPKQGVDSQYITEAFQRRFWYIVLPFFFISLTALLYCIFTPRTYRAQTVILVEPQKVPGEYVSSTVTIDLQSRLRTITQQIKSRTRLEKIINRYDLYPKLRTSATMTDAVERFRENVEVNVRGGHYAFEVSFQDKDPVKARDVTNTLASLFIEDNLRLRESQASGTTDFLDRELERLTQDLQHRERKIREFKEKYMGLLPANMQQNYRMMSHLQGKLDSINDTIQQTKDRKVLLEAQLMSLRRMETQFDGMGGAEIDMIDAHDKNSQPGVSLESANLAELRNHLKRLLSRYSDKHPDVMRTKTAIAKLQKELVAEKTEGVPENGEEDVGDNFPSTAPGPSEGISLFLAQIEDISAQIKLVDREMDELAQQRRKLEAELATYRQRVESGPKTEQMLADAERGYAEVEENYRSLLQKKFKAKLAEKLELEQQGEQFTVLDHAKMPDKPFKPQTGKLLLLGLVLALCGGFGLAIVLEYLDESYYRSKDFENDFHMLVFASIPVIMTYADHRRAFVRSVFSAIALVSMASILLGALYFLWNMDPMAMSLAAN